MTLYRYAAIGERGKKVQGTIDAESLQDAKQKLIRRQILVIKVSSLHEEEIARGLTRAEVLSLTRELTRLIQAGLPLYESLGVLEEKYSKHRVHEVLLDLSDRIRSGQPFSEALSRHPRSFDLLYRAMILNAEKSGNLWKALDEIARLIERQLHVQKQLIGAFLYPALLGTFCLVVLSTLLFFVVPSLFELFEGRELHPFTKFVFACSRFALAAKWPLAVSLAGILGWVGWSIFKEQGRERARQMFRRIPILQELLIKVALSRFFRASAALLEGGLPALVALDQAKATLRHPGLSQSIEQALQCLTEGESLQRALQDRPLIPALVSRMVGIAETGGNLASTMHHISSIYEEDLEKTFGRITTLAQPILLLVLGAIIGFVLLSVLLPLTDVSSFST